MNAAAGRSELAGTVFAAAVAMAAVLGLRAALVGDPSATNFEYMPDMAYSPAAKSQGETGGVPTDRVLPAGVVPRGRLPLRYGDGPDEARRAGVELVNPFPPGDAAVLARGADVYRVQCAVCHGATGEGDGPAVERGMLRPPSFLAQRATTIKDGEMFHVVTRGQGNMAPYAAQVAPDDRWKAILHVRAMQKGRSR